MYQDVKVQKGFTVKHIISASLMCLRWFDSKNWAEVECGPKTSVILELQLWKNNLWDHLIRISPFPPSPVAFRETEARKMKRITHRPVTTVSVYSHNAREATPNFFLFSCIQSQLKTKSKLIKRENEITRYFGSNIDLEAAAAVSSFVV